MSDEYGNVPPPVGGPQAEQPWTQTSYPPPPPPPPGYVPPPPPGAGLSDTAAGAIAYLTFIPAVIFLLIEPYKSRPFVRFHAIQELGLTVVGFVINLIFRFFLWHIPFLGALVWFGCWAVLFVIWLLSLLKASQGGVLKLPLISDFAAQQSGYVI